MTKVEGDKSGEAPVNTSITLWLCCFFLITGGVMVKAHSGWVQRDSEKQISGHGEIMKTFVYSP